MIALVGVYNVIKIKKKERNCFLLASISKKNSSSSHLLLLSFTPATVLLRLFVLYIYMKANQYNCLSSTLKTSSIQSDRNNKIYKQISIILDCLTRFYITKLNFFCYEKEKKFFCFFPYACK